MFSKVFVADLLYAMVKGLEADYINKDDDAFAVANK